MATCPIKRQGCTPVVPHKDDLFMYSQRFEQRVEVTAMLDKGIGTGSALRQLLRIAHTDQIRGDDATKALHIRQNVAPDVGIGRIAVEKDNRITLSLCYIGHLKPEDSHAFFLVGKCCADHMWTAPF